MRDFGLGDDDNIDELYGAKSVLFDGPIRIDQARKQNGFTVTVTATRDSRTVHVNVVSYCPRVGAALK